MDTSMIRLPLAAALIAGLALSGCKRHESTTAVTDTTPAAAPATAPGDAPAAATMPGVPTVSVTSVDLGTAVGDGNRVTNAATTFRPGDTIYVSAATSDTAAPVPIAARWTYQDGQVVAKEERTIEPGGPSVTEFHVSKPDGWPAGTYRVEILVNGQPVQQREFTVQ